MHKPHPSTRITTTPSGLKFIRRHAPFTPASEDREYDVLLDGNCIGSVYQEAEMTEWACDAGIEERYGENIAAGYTNINDVMKDLRATARETR